MDKLEYRKVVKFLVLDRFTEILLLQFQKWEAEFKRGRTLPENDTRERRPKTATTSETIEKVTISCWTIGEKGAEHLAQRIRDAKALRKVWTDSRGIRPIFLGYLSSWMIYHYTPDTKQQSKQWAEDSDSELNQAKSIASTEKVIASVFWDAKEILLIDYLEKGRTITDVSQNLGEEAWLEEEKIIFHKDNASAHKCELAMRKLRGSRYDLLGHPPILFIGVLRL
ncbi:hypothetical protein LAZ67_21001707 [Cordylochernes scorpioides]|uniref:Transposase n=1 Tax=Cordylochernes scorpioides TaxID=51811 RepID=A0ABY6LME1_9ARAC|nr:hypothetical protein LAZ67_21001707 [Cordylochernes scorpioides]